MYQYWNYFGIISKIISQYFILSRYLVILTLSHNTFNRLTLFIILDEKNAWFLYCTNVDQAKLSKLQILLFKCRLLVLFEKARLKFNEPQTTKFYLLPCFIRKNSWTSFDFIWYHEHVCRNIFSSYFIFTKTKYLFIQNSNLVRYQQK